MFKRIFGRSVAVSSGVALLFASGISAQAQEVSEGSAAVADPAAGYQTLMDRQVQLDAAADEISAVAQTIPESGYAGIRVDAANNALDVYWKDDLPQAAARKVKDIGSRSIRITTHRAKFSQKQLAAAADRMLHSEQVQQNHILAVGGKPDGSGLKVSVDRGKAEVGAAATPAGKSAAPITSDVDVDIAPTSAFQDYTREADAGAMWGGGVLTSNGSICSSGFALVWPSIGKRYLVTADHCGAVGSAWGNGQGIAIGNAEGHNHLNDALYINVSSSGGHIYDGPGAANSGQFSKTVTGVATNHWGDMVCTSGAITGAMCGISIDNNTTTADGVNVWMAHQVNGYIAAGHGDSGGPVFSTIGNTYNIDARGLIHGGSSNKTCYSPYIGGNYGCSSDVLFTDITQVVSVFPGLQVQLG